MDVGEIVTGAALLSQVSGDLCCQVCSSALPCFAHPYKFGYHTNVCTPRHPAASDCLLINFIGLKPRCSSFTG